MALSKSEPIVIVGAGIFGLSTALHLARRGYTDVTVLDKNEYNKTHYSYLNGCDAASADINKIIRSAYGAQTEYQALSQEAIAGWNAWNAEIKSGSLVPPGLTTSDRVFINNGHLAVLDDPKLPEFERATIENMEKAGFKDSQLDISNAKNQAIARAKGLGHAIDPFNRQRRNLTVAGVLDTTGGLTVADNACRFALTKAKSLGVKFIFGPAKGTYSDLVYDATGKHATGVKTKDGLTHQSALTIIACGGWTPSILPQLDGLCETTAGSVALLKIPRSSPLFERFAPGNFPSWQYRMRDGASGGLYGFPRNDDGWMKIGYRGTKYTHPKVQNDGKERSVPITRWTEDTIKSIPHQAHKTVQAFIDKELPELASEGLHLSLTRLCWYTDTFDNHFVIDRVPGNQNIMVATGGSGHAFKYLPNIGNWVVDIIEGMNVDRPVIKAWKWRKLEDQKPANVLMEGSKGAHALDNVRLVKESELTSKARLL
ncbi:hypothetical protein KEM56_003591 [Ascosphaera pollenicola]|nr:hypothetical protein KEM56_003591 [Ascosphaera pollenicola]